MEFLNNPWVVGIGGGILSGLIVTLVTRVLFARRENREYLERVSAVNREVVYMLRPGISEGEIPSEEVIESLINATSRKYKVNVSDAYSSRQIAEELVKDIMDSNFISAETKKRYCENLAHLVKGGIEEEAKELSKLEYEKASSEFRQRMVMQMSIILGGTVSIMTMATVFIPYLGGRSNATRTPLSELMSFIVPTIAAITAVFLSAAMVMMRLRRIRGNKQNLHIKIAESDFVDDLGKKAPK